MRVLGRLAVGLGYVRARARLALARARLRLLPTRGWRTLRLGPLAIRVPPDWGEIESDLGGGYIIHNRPRRLRMDGDAVWYGSAIELRIRKPERPSPRSSAPMRVITRELACLGGPVELALARANGVGQGGRRIALKVLGSATVEPSRSAIVWGAPTALAPTDASSPLFHPRISGPPRSVQSPVRPLKAT